MPGRRTIALVALGLGVFLLALGPLLRWYVLPHVQVAPYSEDFTDVSTGRGYYLDPATGKTQNGTITATRHVLGDVAAGQRSGKAVWDVSTRVDTPSTAQLPDARQAFNLTVHRWVFDRHTNRSSTCCGGDIGAGADAYLKFPFRSGPHPYQVWDPVAGRAFRAEFTGTVLLYGRSFNQYTMRIPAIRVGTLQVPPSVVGEKSGQRLVTVEEWYQNPHETYVVDPLTGAPVSGSSWQVVTLRAPGSSQDAAYALDVDLHSTPATDKALVDSISSKHDGLALLSGPAPFALMGIGGVGVVAGAAMLLFGPRKTRRRAASGDSGGAPAEFATGGAVR